MIEYSTTIGWLSKLTYEDDDTLHRYPHRELLVPIPDPPAGEGWEMCGVSNTDARVLWFWRRTKPSRVKTVETPERPKRPRGRPRKARPAPSSQPALDRAVDKQMDRIG